MSEVEVTMVPAELLREVRLDEQARIIELLPKLAHAFEQHQIYGALGECFNCGTINNFLYPHYVAIASALIKGENK